MIRKLYFAGLACCLALLAAPAAAADDAFLWLDRMSQAVQQRNYIGTFVYLHDGHMESMRVVHRRDGDGERERLYSLTGVAREVIRDNEKVTCILPDSESVMVSASKPRSPLRSKWLQDLDQLARSYEIRLDGKDRVIGRLARVVDVLPRDQYRYGHRLWLDVESDLMLKSMVLDERGRVVEQMMFTELELPEVISDSELAPSLNGKDFIRYDDRRKPRSGADSNGEPRWEATGLPAGFELKHHNRHGKSGPHGVMEHLVYGDGLASVSVYIEEAGDDEEMRFRGSSRRGAMNAFGTLADGYQVTAVGEVPAAAVELIGRSVRPRPGAVDD